MPPFSSGVVRRLSGAFLIAGLALPIGLYATHSDVPQAGAKTLFALALNSDDSPATGLTSKDWRLTEDGADRVITDVKIATQPIDLTLVVDTSSGIQSALGQLRTGLMTFTHRIYTGNPGATVSVINAGNAAVRVADRVKAADDLDKVLKRTIPDRALATVVVEGMTEAGQQLGKSPSRRRVLVVVGLDGTLDASGSTEPQRAVNQIAASEASVWVVKYRTDASSHAGGFQGTAAAGVGTDTAGSAPAEIAGASLSGSNRDALLDLLPRASGGLGRTIAVPTALESSLEQIANAVLGQYAITYERPGDTGAPKQLQLGVRGGLTIVYSTKPPR